MPPAPQRLLDEAAFILRAELEMRHEHAEQVALEILSALGIGELDALVAPPPLSNGIAAALADVLERELRGGGRVHVEVLPERIVAPPAVPRPPPSPPLPRPRQTDDTFYDVRFVDETGQGVGPFDVEFALSGETRDVGVSSAGIALLEHVTAMSAAVSVVEPADVDKALDPRWQRFRAQRAAVESNTTEIVFAGQAISNIAVKPVVPNRVLLKPPLGTLFMELRDKTGKVLHADRAYTLEGPMSFEGKTDDQGRLLHTDVFPGDYTLRLTLEFFDEADKRTDVHESPAVVLGPGAGTPEVRMLGAVPRALLAVLHFFFNRNKTFLLPTALSGLIQLRKLYVKSSPATLLVVGHADTKGGVAFNDALSLERAKSVISYLKDDVDAWLANYDTGVDKKQRWGKSEDRMMLVALPDFPTKRRGEDAVRWFQETRGLTVDGKAGPRTRRQLITEYMALDGVSLEEEGIEIDATPHGCGENFPVDDAGVELDEAPEDEKRNPGDRRVELFFFDSEFGIVPEPPGSNSKPGSAAYPKWRKSVTETHDISPGDTLGPKVTFIELLDAYFRTNSAVVLPEGEDPDSEQHQALTSIGMLATALRYNDEHRGKTLLVAGHTDSEGSEQFNQTLSEERAACALALLMGDRESWKTLCDGRHTVADIKQILSWVSRAFEDLTFACDPGVIDDNQATSVQPVRRFQEAYNVNKTALAANGPDLAVDGDVGPLTWGAFFDCYEHALGEELGEEPEGVKRLRETVVFADDEHPALGFSEHFPVEELGVDHYESQANRRVEVLFFDPSEEPDLAHAAEDPETSELYLPGYYERRPLRVDSARPGGTVDLIGVRGTTRFTANADFPKPSLLRAVRAIQARMLEDPTLHVLLIGHADDIGVDQSQQALSLARADAVKAWLTGDNRSLLSRFGGGSSAAKWDWREVQWMLQLVQLDTLPCYVGRVDGYPGPNTHRGLEYFQVKEELEITGLANDATLERLVQRYVELAERPVPSERVRTVGAGKDHPPRAFGERPAEVFPDEAPQRLRRVEALLFPNALSPSEAELPGNPRVYVRWCQRAIAAIDVSEPLPTLIALTDESDGLLRNTSFSVIEVDNDGNQSAIAAGSTDEQAIAKVMLPEGYYVVRAGDLQGVIDVSHDEFGAETLTVLSSREA